MSALPYSGSFFENDKNSDPSKRNNTNDEILPMKKIMLENQQLNNSLIDNKKNYLQTINENLQYENIDNNINNISQSSSSLALYLQPKSFNIKNNFNDQQQNIQHQFFEQQQQQYQHQQQYQQQQQQQQQYQQQKLNKNNDMQPSILLSSQINDNQNIILNNSSHLHDLYDRREISSQDLKNAYEHDIKLYETHVGGAFEKIKHVNNKHINLVKSTYEELEGLFNHSDNILNKSHKPIVPLGIHNIIEKSFPINGACSNPLSESMVYNNINNNNNSNLKSILNQSQLNNINGNNIIQQQQQQSSLQQKSSSSISSNDILLSSSSSNINQTQKKLDINLVNSIYDNQNMAPMLTISDFPLCSEKNKFKAFGHKTKYMQGYSIEPSESEIGDLNNCIIVNVLISNVVNNTPYDIGISITHSSSSSGEICELPGAKAWSDEKSKHYHYISKAFERSSYTSCNEGRGFLIFKSESSIENEYTEIWDYISSDIETLRKGCKQVVGDLVAVPFQSPIAMIYINERFRRKNWPPIRIGIENEVSGCYLINKHIFEFLFKELYKTIKLTVPCVNISSLRIQFDTLYHIGARDGKTITIGEEARLCDALQKPKRGSVSSLINFSLHLSYYFRENSSTKNLFTL